MMPASGYFSICAVFRNEAAALNEWLTFHHGCGCEHVVLFNDESTDDFASVLKPWRDRGLVSLQPARGPNQIEIDTEAANQLAGHFRWTAFLDLDEFLFSPEQLHLPAVLQAYEEHPAVFVHWRLFGSSGHARTPAAGVLRSFTDCLGLSAASNDTFEHGDPEGPDYVTGWSRDGKSVVDPAAVIEMGAHLPRGLHWGRVCDETHWPALRHGPPGSPLPMARLRINHYWSKGDLDLEDKVARGSIFNRNRPRRSLERWRARASMLSGTQDHAIQPLWNAICLESDGRLA